MEGLAISAGQTMSDVSPDLKPEPFDPQGAKKMPAEAGYADGFGITPHGPDNHYVARAHKLGVSAAP